MQRSKCEDSLRNENSMCEWIYDDRDLHNPGPAEGGGVAAEASLITVVKHFWDEGLIKQGSHRPFAEV